jgi:hypothetical protein
MGDGVYVIVESLFHFLKKFLKKAREYKPGIEFPLSCQII